VASSRSRVSLRRQTAEVLRHPLLVERPPVIVDLGASGRDPRWDALKSTSILVAADADARDFGSSEGSGWLRRLAIASCIVPHSEPEANFYLTADPHCSSSLAPRSDALAPWMFADRFRVVEERRLPAVNLAAVLSDQGISSIDWIKLDTQGTDLRLLDSLPPDMWSRCAVVQMEPGIMDAYAGEDKLHDVLRRFDGLDYFVAELDVRGTQRFTPQEWAQLPWFVRRWPNRVQRPAVGWAEVSFLRAYERESGLEPRDLLWTWLCAVTFSQWGHALHLSRLGTNAFADPAFERCTNAVRTHLARRGPLSLVDGVQRVVTKPFRRS
jgi:hypothetical protein